MSQERISRAVDTVDRRVGTGAPPIPGRPRRRGVKDVLPAVGLTVAVGTGGVGAAVLLSQQPRSSGSPDSSHNIVGAAPSLSPEVSASGVTVNFPSDDLVARGVGGEMFGVGSGIEIAVNLPPNPPEIVPPTPGPTQAPTSSPVRTESPTPVLTPEPTPQPESIDQNLSDWLNKKGKYKTFDDQKKFFTYEGHPAVLGNLGKKEGSAWRSPQLQGVLLDWEVTKNNLLVGYVGQEDYKGNRYYFGVTFGHLSDTFTVTRDIFTEGRTQRTGVAISNDFTTNDLKEILDVHKGQAIMFFLINFDRNPNTSPNPANDNPVRDKQTEKTKMFAPWNYNTTYNKSVKDKSWMRQAPIPINTRDLNPSLGDNPYLNYFIVEHGEK